MRKLRSKNISEHTKLFKNKFDFTYSTFQVFFNYFWFFKALTIGFLLVKPKEWAASVWDSKINTCLVVILVSWTGLDLWLSLPVLGLEAWYINSGDFGLLYVGFKEPSYQGYEEYLYVFH